MIPSWENQIMLEKNILDYIEQHKDETYQLLKTIAQIPAPSNKEEKRSGFCLNLLESAKEILSDLTGEEIAIHAGSTDCNIPLSMNIPSLCYGFYNGARAHTREEYVLISSLHTGYKAAFASILDYFELKEL